MIVLTKEHYCNNSDEFVRIGTGSYGYLSLWKKNEVVVKYYFNSMSDKEIEREIKIIEILKEENYVIRIKGLLLDNEIKSGILIEYMNNGDIRTYLNKNSVEIN